MAMDGAGEPRCPGTGLTVPECSCSGCLEAMLRELHPELLSAEIRVSRPQHTSGLDERPQR